MLSRQDLTVIECLIFELFGLRVAQWLSDINISRLMFIIISITFTYNNNYNQDRTSWLIEGSMFELLGLRIAPFLFRPILNIFLRKNWLLLKLVCWELYGDIILRYKCAKLISVLTILNSKLLSLRKIFTFDVRCRNSL